MNQEEKYYEFNWDRFRKLAKTSLKGNVHWRRYKLVLAAIVGFAIVCFAICVVKLPQMAPSPDRFLLWVSIGVGTAIASVLLVIDAGLYFLGIRRYGDPYVNMMRPFLYTNRSGIQFGYHNFKDKKMPESMDVWQIAYPNVQCIVVDERKGWITVQGRVESIQYYNLMENRIKHSYTDGQFGDFGSFSFFDCFSDRKNFFNCLKQHNVTVQFK